MKTSENNFGIILINRGGFELFDVNQKKVFPYKFSDKHVKDMEIINKNELETQLSLFINFYKIKSAPLLMIFSKDICFDLEINDLNDASFENKVNNFLYYLPFEETVHKIYKQAKGYYIVAINKDLIDSFKYIFSKLGFAINIAVPASVVGIDIKTIDLPAADFITAKINQIKEQSMIFPETPRKEHKTEEKKVMGVNRVFILLSLFILLLFLLLFILYQQSVSNKKISNHLTSKFVFSSVNIEVNLPA